MPWPLAQVPPDQRPGGPSLLAAGRSAAGRPRACARPRRPGAPRHTTTTSPRRTDQRLRGRRRDRPDGNHERAAHHRLEAPPGTRRRACRSAPTSAGELAGPGVGNDPAAVRVHVGDEPAPAAARAAPGPSARARAPVPSNDHPGVPGRRKESVRRSERCPIRPPPPGVSAGRSTAPTAARPTKRRVSSSRSSPSRRPTRSSPCSGTSSPRTGRPCRPWARNLAYRLACLQRPDDPRLLREAAADLLCFGPDWENVRRGPQEARGGTGVEGPGPATPGDIAWAQPEHVLGPHAWARDSSD